MFTDKNGRVYRNLEEQVLEVTRLVNSIINGNVVLAEFGLKIIYISTDGTIPVDPPELLPGDTTTFGYSWLVRNSTNPDDIFYDLYVWTRINAATETDGWVNMGEFPKRGDTGATGAQGAKGDTGDRGIPGLRGNFWNFVTNPATITGMIEGDMALTTNYDLYRYNGVQWSLIGNIKGATGATGAIGPQGYTPYIENGNWFINGVDTGVRAEGKDGTFLNLQAGTWTVATLPAFSATSVGDAFVVTDDPTYQPALYFNGVGGTTWTIMAIPIIKGEDGKDGADGAQGAQGRTGTSFWGFAGSQVNNIADASPTALVGDYIINLNESLAIYILGVLAEPGNVIKSTSAVAGVAAGTLRNLNDTGAPSMTQLFFMNSVGGPGSFLDDYDIVSDPSNISGNRDIYLTPYMPIIITIALNIGGIFYNTPPVSFMYGDGFANTGATKFVFTDANIGPSIVVGTVSVEYFEEQDSFRIGMQQDTSATISYALANVLTMRTNLWIDGSHVV